MRPLFSVVLTPSTPMIDERFVTCRILQDGIGQRLLPSRHLGEGNVLVGGGDALYLARVLMGKKPFGIYILKQVAAKVRIATMRAKAW